MIIFLYGEDDFRAKKKIRELKDKFFRDVDKSGGSIEFVDGKTATLKEINEKAATASLLAAKRMIIIEDIFSNRDKELLPELSEYFKNKEKNNWGNIVVFCDNSIKGKKKFNGEEIVKTDKDGRDKPLGKKEKELFDFLAKQKFAQEFKKLNNQDFGAWIKNEVEARGGAISSRAIQVLIGLVGYDLWQIDSEISKLINFKAGGKAPLLFKEGLGVVDKTGVADGVGREPGYVTVDSTGTKEKTSVAATTVTHPVASGTRHPSREGTFRLR